MAQYDCEQLKNTDNLLILPDCNAELIFLFLNGNMKIFVNIAVTTFSSINNSYVNLLSNSSANTYSENDSLFTVAFVPGVISLITNRTAEQFTHGPLEISSNILINAGMFIEKMEISSSFDERVELVKEYLCSIEENLLSKDLSRFIECCEELMYSNSVQKASGKLGYSERHFSRIFKRFIGISPKEYIDIVRLQQSFMLLINHAGKDIGEIAWQSGYYDSSHMNKAYIRITECVNKSL